MTYQIEVKRSAAHELRRLPKNIRRRLAAAIDSLSHNPGPRGYIQLESETFSSASASATIE
jgi:mRNA-degrading endonuclease RelE of RelBE toxin-antitoxin system